MVIHSQISTDRRAANTSGNTGIRASIRRRPLIWFYMMANLLSWAAWTPYVLSGNGLGILRFRFPTCSAPHRFSGCCPAPISGPFCRHSS